jgi:hypothetical protein
MLKKLINSTLAIILAVIVLAGFTRPAFAWTEAEFRPQIAYEQIAFVPSGEVSGEFAKGFFSGLGAAIGGVVGTMAACYAVDVLVVPVNPLAAGYLATLCPSIGAAVGGASGFVSTNTVLSQ